MYLRVVERRKSSVGSRFGTSISRRIGGGTDGIGIIPMSVVRRKIIYKIRRTYGTALDNLDTKLEWSRSHIYHRSKLSKLISM